MDRNRMLAIFRKDLIDAIRDARVLVAILVPLGLGILYNAIFDDEPPQPEATIAYTAAESTALTDHLRAVAGATVKLTLTEVDSADEVRALVGDEKADLGLIVPAGFDAAVERGEAPALSVLLPDPPTFGGDYLLASLDPAARRMAGQAPPVTIQTETVTTGTDDPSAVFEQLGLRRYFVLAVTVMLIAMISMLALPVILAEETEKKTLDALVLIASYTEVIVAKALVGLVYIAVSVGLLLSVTGLVPENLPVFAGGIAVLSVALIGFGLLLGGLFRSANQLNTWSGFILLPVIGPVFLVGVDAPEVVETLLSLLPTPQATRLIVNGLSGEALYPDIWFSFLVIAAWAALAYGLLLRSLARRQA